MRNSDGQRNVLGRRRLLATAAVAGVGVALVESGVAVAAPTGAGSASGASGSGSAGGSGSASGATAGSATTGSATAGSTAVAAAVSASPDPLHLLRRATYGRTPDAEAELRSLGVAAWLDRQLNPKSIDDTTCDSLIARFPLVNLDITGVRKAVKKGAWDAMQQLGTAAVARACWSKRQLFEVMVDFWANHLNVTCPSSDVWDSRPDYDRTVIRAHALGRFADMLKASAAHPAMLSYLDNRVSTKDKPNENYGRELMELHTVGLNYTEQDVKQAAVVLTGRTVDAATGLYKYDAAKHATGAVTILGWKHANATDGEKAGNEFLDYLAMHPKTAERIATKLCVRFVADEPPATLVATLAKVYLDSRTAIAPVLKALFTSAEFAQATNAKVKTPLEDIASTVRILGVDPDMTGTDGIRALYQILDKTGHGPMRWEPPNGYPDVAAAWASPSGFLVRWNAHLNLAAGWYPKQLTRKTPLLNQLVPGALPATYGALVETVVKSLIGTGPKPEHTAALTQFFGKKPIDLLKAKDQAVTGKFPHLVALVLDSPMFQVR